jgi:hypothetical protein
MAKPRIAHITDSTVGRHRINGRDADGRNVEEKICPLRSIVVLDGDGNECTVAIENARIPSEDGARYGQRELESGIKDRLWIPKNLCPHTARFSHLVAGPLVAGGEGAADCGGKPDGCEHYQAVKSARRARAAQKAKERKIKPEDPGAVAILQLAQSLDSHFKGAAASAPGGVGGARDNLRKGKGEV